MKSLLRFSALALTMVSALTLMAYESGTCTESCTHEQATSVRIADFVDRYISLSMEENRNATRMERISTAEASFIKVHFEYFNLPDNVYVEVSNPEGTEVYRYANEKRDDFTWNKEFGEDGSTSFASMSITGGEAVVRLIAVGSVDWRAERGHGVVISRYMEGYPEEVIRALTGETLTGERGEEAGGDNRSTCGSNQRTDAVCYQSSHPTEFERSDAVARMVIGGSLCTGWRVSDSNLMFTNNHCMSTQSAVAGSEAWFNYQRTSCGGSLGSNVKVSGATMFKTDYTLDYTLFSVNNFSSITSFGNLGLDVRTPVLNEEIYIPQHGSGNPKELAIESDQNSGNVCRVDDAIANGRGTNTDMGYYCDTIGGSSGSPVLARSTHKVIALHHLGGCLNKGARIELIWPQVSTYFGGVIPNGSGGSTGGNQSPNANFSYSTSTLTANFTDSSSDPDGSIASRSWNFGDGGSSSATNPSHTYASSGTYTVTLTVTDNNGATDSTSQSVTVSSGGGGTPTLTNGQTVSNLSATSGNWIYYKINLPSGASNLSVAISGGSGDADLYLRFGSQPTTGSYDCRPYLSGNNENCTVASPNAGDYYIGIRAYTSFSGVSLTASFTPPSTGGGPAGGGSVSSLTATSGNWLHYYVDVPAGMSRLEVDISGGTGDADLYVRFNSQPTTSSWDYRPYLFGNNESVTVNNPTAGRWYCSLRAYTTFSGVTLEVYYFN
jgi:hypothetical protein